MRALLYVTIRRLVNALKNIPRNPRLLLPVVFFLLAFAAPVFQFLLIHDDRSALPPAAFTPREFVSGDPGVLVEGVRTLLLL